MPKEPQEPDADHAAALDALMATSRLMTAVVARTLAAVEESVSVPQLRVLVMLRYGGPRNLTAIAAGLGVNPSNASRTCDKLAAAGLVTRVEQEADRRHLSVSLSARGQRLVDSLMDARRRQLDEAVTALSATDQRRLTRGLSAFLTAVDDVGAAPDEAAGDAILSWLR